MTNEVDVWAQSKPIGAFAGLNPAEESLGAGIGGSYGVVGYRGKVWSFRHGGENHMFLRPDDGSPINYIDVVILRAPDVKSRSYYEGWEEGTVGKRPICASMDGVRPDSDVQERQAQVCALCPRNEWYTNNNGKKTKDCSDYKRLAVLLVPQFSAQMLGEPLIEPVFLRVPGGSLVDLKAFGDAKAKEGWHYSSFITRISFVPGESYPKFEYKAVAPIRDEDFGKLVMAMREDAIAKRITGEETGGAGGMRDVSEAPPVQPEHPSTVQRTAPPASPPVPPKPVERDVIDLTPQPGGEYGERLLPAHLTRDTRSPPAEKPAETVHAVGQSAADVGEAVHDPAMESLLADMLAVQ